MKTSIRLFGLFCFGIAFQLLSAQNPDIFVTSRDNNSVKRFDGNTGVFKGDFVAPGLGGLSAPQEVVFHPSGDLLVTARFNSAIKRYDGTSGAFKGDFTSGYLLDNPTKTRVGPDGYLYVSQWGANQNKVVRFNFETGVFIDEFTSTGVPNGCGQAWDEEGNLYVGRYGNGTNGNVHKFDTLGNFTGIYLNSSILQGPTNVWFGEDEALWVADWTVGEVLRFDNETGTFLNKPITGLQSVEGFAFDGNGNLFICDWNGNAVFKYELATGNLQLFANGNGLSSPNSITFGPESTATKELIKNPFSVSSYPNPFVQQTFLQVLVDKTTFAEIQILDETGKILKKIPEQKLMVGAHQQLIDMTGYPSGLYFYKILSNGFQQTGKLLLKE